MQEPMIMIEKKLIFQILEIVNLISYIHVLGITYLVTSHEGME